MKKIAGLFVMACFITLTCSHNKPDGRTFHFKNKYVSIDFDTVYVDCDRNLGSMILLNDVYYIFSRRIFEFRDSRFIDQTEKFYGFSRRGEKLFEIDVVDLFRSYYYLYPLDDKLIASIRGHKNFYFDQRELCWKSIAKTDRPLFEDKDYYVTSSCSGEWGGTIYFKDKHTGKIYEGSSTCPAKVTKYDGKYYVSNYLGHMFGHSSLFEIADPRDMSVYTGERPQEDRYIDERECRSTEGMKKLADIMGYFGEPEYDSVLKTAVSRSREVELLSSFVRKKQLLHLYSDDNDVFICKLADSDSAITKVRDDRIDNIYRFKSPMRNNPWIKFSKEDYQQLNLNTGEKNCSVIMEITPSKIFVHYIINKNKSPQKP